MKKYLPTGILTVAVLITMFYFVFFFHSREEFPGSCHIQESQEVLVMLPTY